jgi:hypothetical protein
MEDDPTSAEKIIKQKNKDTDYKPPKNILANNNFFEQPDDLPDTSNSGKQ